MDAEHQTNGGSEIQEKSWIDFAVRPKRAIERAISAGHLFEPWAILITIEWLPIVAILVTAAAKTSSSKYFLVIATIIVVGIFLATCLEAFLMFGCLWIFTRVFGARERSRDFAIAFAVASRGPAVIGSIVIVMYSIAALSKGQSESAGNSNWMLYLGLVLICAIAVWYAWLISKAIRAVYDIPRFGVIFTIVVGGLVLPAFIPTDWMSKPFVGSYSLGSQSMQPAHTSADQILTNNSAYGIRSELLGKYLVLIEAPLRGDIVVFESPISGEEYLKRVVAVAGDRIGVAGNQLVINDKPISLNRTGEHWYYQHDEDGRIMGRVRTTRWLEKQDDAEYSVLHIYCESRRECFHFGNGTCDQDEKTCVFPDFNPITVPENHVFVLGDNRDNSRDSRYFGPVPVDNVKGKVLLVYFPFTRTGLIRTGPGR